MYSGLDISAIVKEGRKESLSSVWSYSFGVF